jgi:hypothetical protein
MQEDGEDDEKWQQQPIGGEEEKKKDENAADEHGEKIKGERGKDPLLFCAPKTDNNSKTYSKTHTTYTAAGVLCYSIAPNGQLYIVLGKEQPYYRHNYQQNHHYQYSRSSSSSNYNNKRYNNYRSKISKIATWCEFTGSFSNAKDGDDIERTAAREFLEESAGLLYLEDKENLLFLKEDPMAEILKHIRGVQHVQLEQGHREEKPSHAQPPTQTQTSLLIDQRSADNYRRLIYWLQIPWQPEITVRFRRFRQFFCRLSNLIQRYRCGLTDWQSVYKFYQTMMPFSFHLHPALKVTKNPKDGSIIGIDCNADYLEKTDLQYFSIPHLCELIASSSSSSCSAWSPPSAFSSSSVCSYSYPSGIRTRKSVPVVVLRKSFKEMLLWLFSYLCKK